MSQHNLSHYIPRRLDDRGKFLFWEIDVVGVAFVGILIGIVTEYRIGGLILGILLAAAYKKLKSGRHPGIAAHLSYWFAGTPTPKSLPASHYREFNG